MSFKQQILQIFGCFKPKIERTDEQPIKKGEISGFSQSGFGFSTLFKIKRLGRIGKFLSEMKMETKRKLTRICTRDLEGAK